MSKLRRTSVGISTLNVDWLINVNDLEFISVLREQDNVTIYKAYWRKYQIVCVKKVVVTMENVKLVEREIDILSKCIHPMICQYFGTGILDSEVYMLFEYMENGNLEDYMILNPLSIEQQNHILTSILVGMNYLSSRNPEKILHRDFKPTNILVNKHREVKICDFGVSKQLFNDAGKMKKSISHNMLMSHSLQSSDNSHTGIGTLRWAAPEIILDEDLPYDERCDIYSFGLLAFFVVTNGVVPYFDEYKNNLAQIAFAKSMHKRPFLSHHRLECYPKMLDMVTKCTEKDPSLRPKDANSILSEFFSDFLETKDTSLRYEEIEPASV